MEMVLVPIRCRIPEHLHRIGKTQQWLADRVAMSKQQMSDYVTMRFVLKIAKAKEIADVLNINIDDLYEWEWRGE
ncbi:helix-turn-helix transcriptional regulator [Paenibacillus plantiphilus]|nr:helix-turn-helix transcriptional regulator [Paenibacillus plantiphilus]